MGPLPAGCTPRQARRRIRCKRRVKGKAYPPHLPSSSESDDGFTASDVSSASEGGSIDGATGPELQLPVNAFRQWAAKEAPHLLQYPKKTTDAGAYLTLEEDDGHEAKGGHILELRACKDDQKVVEEQGAVDTISTLVKSDQLSASYDIQFRAARDDELIAACSDIHLSAAKDDQLRPARDDEWIAACDIHLSAAKDDQLRAARDIQLSAAKDDELSDACYDQLSAACDDKLSAARDDQEVVEQQDGIHPMDETTCDIAAHDQAKDSIKINITESLDVEVISRKQVKSTDIYGKMVVKFPPPRGVEHSMLFAVSKLSEINYTACPLVDRELFKKIPVLRSQRFPDFFELLKWRRKNGYLPLPLTVTAEAIVDPRTKEYVKGFSKYFVVISCLPTGLTDIRDVVVTIPFPSVDHIGIERKTRKHIWKSVGTHEELENSIEWKIPYIGASDKSAHMDVDAFCNDGWQKPWQFFPITIDFSYDQSIGSKVSQVVRSDDGLAVDFRQDTVARCSYTVHHPNEPARRAAEASEEQLAWQLAPWAPWGDEGVEDDPWEDEGVEDEFV